MKKLFCPWRKNYTQSVVEGAHQNVDAAQCDFCIQLNANNDPHYFIFKRFAYSFVLLNKYPYNAGHLLILPLAHNGQLHELPKETRMELMELTSQSVRIANEILGAHGVNVGINLGRAAGAGMPSHLHIHILPRYEGDTNFLPVLGATKQVSFDLTDLYHQLKPHFDLLEL